MKPKRPLRPRVDRDIDGLAGAYSRSVVGPVPIFQSGLTQARDVERERPERAKGKDLDRFPLPGGRDLPTRPSPRIFFQLTGRDRFQRPGEDCQGEHTTTYSGPVLHDTL